MSHRETIETLMQDWKRKDIEAVLAHVSEDVEYFYAIGAPPIRGKATMRKFLTRLAGHQNELAWRIKSCVETEDMLMLEGVDDYVTADGQHVQNPHMTVYEFRDGLITGWRDYFDLGVMQKIEEDGEVPEPVLALVNR